MYIENKDLNEALDYINQSLEGEYDERYWGAALSVKRNILEKLGRTDEAEEIFDDIL